MTKEEYLEKKEAIDKKANEEKTKLTKEYCESNNPYKVGDVIESGGVQGRILSWTVRIWGSPYLLYKCERLTKKGTVNKRDPEVMIHQEHSRKVEL